MHFDFAPVIEDLNFVSVQGRYKGNFEILVGFGSMFTPAFHVHVSAFFFSTCFLLFETIITVYAL